MDLLDAISISIHNSVQVNVHKDSCKEGRGEFKNMDINTEIVILVVFTF